MPINAVFVTVFLIHGTDLEYIKRGKVMGNNPYDNAITDKYMSEECKCGHLRGEHSILDGDFCFDDNCDCQRFES